MSAHPDTTKHRALDGALVHGMGVVGIFVAVSSALRLAQDAAIAWRFGTGAMVDAYYFLANLAGWPIAVALSCLSLLIAPVDARVRSTGPAAAQRFRSELLGWGLVVAAVSLPLAWYLMRAIAGSPLGGLNPSAAAQASAGAAVFSVVVPVGLLGALMSAWLVSSGRHILALLEGLPSLALLVLVLLAPGPVLFWGSSVGVLLQVLAMALVLRNSGELPPPHLQRSSLHWQDFSQGALLLLAAQIAFGLVPLIDTFFAARLGEGTLAAFSYTNRLVLGLQGLAGLGLQRSGLPLLSSLAVRSHSAARRTALRWALIMGALGAAGGALVAFSSDFLVTLVFRRGSFTADDAAQCGTLLRYAMLQMPLFLGGLVLVTALASISARRALALIAVLDVIVKLIASVLLVRWLGAAGLMVATALMYGAAAAIGWVALRHRLDKTEQS